MRGVCISTRNLSSLFAGFALPYTSGAMDPFSIVAGVLGIVSVAAQSSKSLCELIDTVRSAPSEVKNISRDTHAFYNILFSLESSLKDSKVTAAIADDESLITLLANLSEPLKNCTNILGQLMVKIQGFIRPLDGERKRFSSNDLKWWMGKKEILELTSRVDATKATLNTGLTAVGTLCNIKLVAVGNSVPRKPIRRGSGDTDAGFALRRYVEEIETTSQYASSTSPPRPSIEDLHKIQLNSDTTLQGTGSSKSGDQVIDKVERLRRAENQRNALLAASHQGDGLLVEVAVEEGADINAKGPDGNAAIHIAVIQGHTDIVRLLLDLHANIDITTTPLGDRRTRKFNGGRTALHWAAVKGHEDIARLLIDKGADINAKNCTDRTALQEAIGQNSTSGGITQLLLERGASITIHDDEGWTPLHQAAHTGNAQIIDELINRGCNIEAQTSDTTVWDWSRSCRATPLFLAAAEGREAAVRALLARGANPRCRNLIGEFPLHVACWRGFPFVVRIMLDLGIDIEEKDIRYEETPLLKAASTGQVGVLKLLVDRGADLDAETQWGRNALQHARLHRKEGNEEAVRYLTVVYEKREKQWEKLRQLELEEEREQEREREREQEKKQEEEDKKYLVSYLKENLPGVWDSVGGNAEGVDNMWKRFKTASESMGVDLKEFLRTMDPHDVYEALLN